MSNLDNERLCIKLQPRQEGWYWQVAHPQGVTLQDGWSETFSEASRTANAVMVAYVNR